MTIAVAVLIGTAAVAQAEGDATKGHALARQWCTGCHVVDEGGPGPDTAPPFATIARRQGGDHAWVRAWLAAPHPPMPNFNLTRQQIADIVAYLDSLTKR
jgi:mono/diheme cytochrome c family protein